MPVMNFDLEDGLPPVSFSLKDSDAERFVAFMAECDAALKSASPATAPLQQRVQPWMMECFGPTISADTQERNHRFLEEALELVQACGATQSEAHQLVDYVYGRPVGEKKQEVGGVMITLAALCLANDLDMHQAGETELLRIWTMVDQIRAKQAAKPKHSPLPVSPVQAEQPNVVTMLLDVVRCAHDAMSNSEDDGMGVHWCRADFESLSAAMDKLDALSDDRPGYVMGPAAKAEWAVQRAAAAPAPQLPPMDDELRFILGRPNFRCITTAQVLRQRGQNIAKKAEDEQAATIYFMLQHYLEHGPQAWLDKAEEYLRKTPAAPLEKQQ